MQYSKWVFLVVGALCIIMVAGFVGASNLYQMAALLLMLPVVSWLLGWLTLRGLEFRREPTESGWEGEESEFKFVARNPTPLPRYFLHIHETLPPGIESVAPESLLFNAPANDEARAVQRVRFRKRGVYALPSFEVSALDPLGVFAFVRRVSYPGEITIYPRLMPLEQFSVAGAERHGAQEFTSPLQRGSSVDPDGVRRYAPGDPLRRIHWRQTARTGQLSVIEFEESQSRDLVIALDLQRNGYGVLREGDPDSLLEQAVRFAGSCAQEALRQNAGVRLLLPMTETPDETTQGAFEAAAHSRHGQNHLYTVLNALARVEANAGETIREVIARRSSYWAPGASLLVITGQADPLLPDVLRGCVALGVGVMVALIVPTATGKAGSWSQNSEPDSAAQAHWLDELAAIGARVYQIRGVKNAASWSESVSVYDAVAG